jgi:ketosteroid isomerase-like protein
MCLISLSFLHVSAQSADAAVRAVLNEQIKTWNNGDIDAFMKTYWKSDSLLFIGKGGPVHGWQTTLENYKRNYPDKAAMGTLYFDILEIRSLSQDYNFVVGKWHLARSSGDLGGYFTLLF